MAKERMHPAGIRARRIKSLTEFLKHTDIEPEKQMEELVREAMKTWGVQKQTAKDYATAVLLITGRYDN